MKENLIVTNMNLITNFISNASFFRRYGVNVYGLTGTIGSTNEKQLLLELYTLDTIFIPSFKTRKLHELKGVICRNNDEWLKYIKYSILNETRNGRAVLVICKTIANVNEINLCLLDIGFDQKNVKLITDGNVIEEQIVRMVVQSKSIILATNLAGRGTDLKTSNELENNGGLHVCLTFLPINQRVQDQAFGRTGRQGNLGTCQLVINLNSINSKYSVCKTIEEVTSMRDQIEKACFDAVSETTSVLNKDALFVEYCKLSTELNSCGNQIYNQAIEERWAIWLSTVSKDQFLNITLLNESFVKFKNSLKYGNMIKNPKNFISQVHNHYQYDKQHKYEEALESYKYALELSKNDWQAHYYVAMCKIRLQEYNLGSNQYSISNSLLDDAIISLKKSLEFCLNELVLYQCLSNMYNISNLNINNNKIELLLQVLFDMKKLIKEIELGNSFTYIYFDKYIEWYYYYFYEKFYQLKELELLVCDGFIFVVKPVSILTLVSIILITFVEAFIIIYVDILSFHLFFECISDLLVVLFIYITCKFHLYVYVCIKIISISLYTYDKRNFSKLTSILLEIIKLIVLCTLRSILMLQYSNVDTEEDFELKYEIKDVYMTGLTDTNDRMNSIVKCVPTDIYEKQYKIFEELFSNKLRDCLQTRFNIDSNYIFIVPSVRFHIFESYNIALVKKLDENQLT